MDKLIVRGSTSYCTIDLWYFITFLLLKEKSLLDTNIWFMY